MSSSCCEQHATTVTLAAQPGPPRRCHGVAVGWLCGAAEPSSGSDGRAGARTASGDRRANCLVEEGELKGHRGAVVVCDVMAAVVVRVEQQLHAPGERLEVV